MWIDQRLQKHGVLVGIISLLSVTRFVVNIPRALLFYLVTKPMADYKLSTKQIHWMQKQKITTSGVALTASTMTDSDVPADAWKIAPGENSVEMRFLCAENNIGGTARIYARKKVGDSVSSDLVLIAQLAITSGAQETIREGATVYYVDTISVTGHWMKTLATADIDGNDRMSRIGFDAIGYRTIFVRIEFTGSRTWYVDSTGF